MRDAEATRAHILDVATDEFAEKGFSGARVDEIADRTRTTKRMIYYYFGSKEGLYLQALEVAYAGIRALEERLDVDHLPPLEALRQLAEATFDHHTSHRAFIRLVMVENVHHAAHLERSAAIRELNSTAVATLERVLERGVEQGVVRDDVDALDVHAVISAYAVFHVANRDTFRVSFGRDLLDPTRLEHRRRLAGDVVVAMASAGGGTVRRPGAC